MFFAHKRPKDFSQSYNLNFQNLGKYTTHLGPKLSDAQNLGASPQAPDNRIYLHRE